jgi:hypothetical protein
MDHKEFDKIIYKAIKKSPETLDFLRGQAKEILDIEIREWKSKNSEEDYKDPLNWGFYSPSVERFDKYLYKWFSDVRNHVRVMNSEDDNILPDQIKMIFEHFIDVVTDYVHFYDLSEELMIEAYEEIERNQKKDNTNGL